MLPGLRPTMLPGLRPTMPPTARQGPDSRSGDGGLLRPTRSLQQQPEENLWSTSVTRSYSPGGVVAVPKSSWHRSPSPDWNSVGDSDEAATQ